MTRSCLHPSACLLLLCVVYSLPCHAQHGASNGANGTGPVQRTTLGNGLRVVMAEAQSTTVATCIEYAVGSRDEPPGKTGLAQLVERLMFQGSRNLGPNDVHRLVTERGGQTHSLTTVDTTRFCTVLPAADVALGLWIEADRMKNLSVTRQGFLTQRELLSDELRAGAFTGPHSTGSERLSELSYQHYWPYQHGLRGSDDDLYAIDLQDAADFHWSYYTPGNAVLSIVGKIDSKRASELVAQYFGSIEARRAAAPPPPPRENLRQSSERLTVQSDENSIAPGVFYGYRVAKIGTFDHRVMQLIAMLLSGMDSARLPQSLIAERGSALHTTATLWGYEQLDLLEIQAAVAPLSSVDKVQEVVEAELKRLRFFGPTPEELAKAKSQFQRALLRRSETSLGLAATLAHRELMGLQNSTEDELALLQSITPDQVRSVAQMYLQDHKRSVVELYPPGWPQDEAPLIVVLKHTVKRGENLETIARRYGSSVSEIARASGISAKQLIQVGQVLKVPVISGGKPISQASVPRSHKVRSGDSLSMIAKIYGTSVAEIVRLNGLDKNKPIIVGQKLTIPPKAEAETESAPSSKGASSKSSGSKTPTKKAVAAAPAKQATPPPSAKKPANPASNKKTK